MNTARGWSEPHSHRARICLVALLLLHGCDAVGRKAPEDDLAVFEGGAVSRIELQRWARERLGSRRPSAEQRTALLRELAGRKIVALSKADHPEVLAAARRAEESYRIEALRARRGWERLAVTEDEIRSYYDAHPEAFSRPETLRLQHIFLGVDPTREEVDQRQMLRVRLEQIRRLAEQGHDFGELARRYSDSADREAGGWMALERGAPAIDSFMREVWGLREGQISRIVESDSGFHLARLETRVPATSRPLEEVEEAVRAKVRQERLHRLEEEFRIAAAEQHGLERFYSRLRDRTAREATVLLRAAGQEVTLGRLRRELRGPELLHLVARDFGPIEERLDRMALDLLLVAEESELDIEELQALDRRGVVAARARAIELALEEWAAALDVQALREHYERGRARYERPRRRSISLVYLSAEPREMWATVTRAAGLVQEIREGRDFAAVAKEHSQHWTYESGGRLTDLTDEELAAQIPGRGAARLDGLAVGEISAPFLGEVYDREEGRYRPTGVFVVRLDDTKPIRQASFEEAEPRVRASLLRRHRGRALEEVLERARRDAGYRELSQ